MKRTADDIAEIGRKPTEAKADTWPSSASLRLQ